MILALIILFVLAYGDGDTPDSTVDGEGQPMVAYDNLIFDYFDYLHGVSCAGMQEEL
jgi:hypothetical protein